MTNSSDNLSQKFGNLLYSVCIESRRLTKSRDPYQWLANELFKRWFHQRGKSFFFLFKKNLSVTNIQFSEILALIRIHTNTEPRHNVPPKIHFLTAATFKRVITGLLEHFMLASPRRGNLRMHCRSIAKIYEPIFSRLVIADAFHGSCAIFLPPHLHLDLARICAESGYVHSCGEMVYIRRVDKVEEDEFVEALESHLSRTRRGKHNRKKSFLSIYSHEDFSEWDGKYKAELIRGLEDNKIFVEKAHLGRERLVTVLNQLRKDFKETLALAEGGDYREKQIAARKTLNCDLEHNLWLLVDRSSSEQTDNLRYYICYDQLYINENPFHIFDENKPAWVDHTTIPHTLLAAMINLSRPWWTPNRRIKVLDPFSGSGTTALEFEKFQMADIESSDSDPIAQLLLRDNILFFAMSEARLRDMRTRLMKVADSVLGSDISNITNHSNADLRHYKWVTNVLKMPRMPQGANDGIPRMSLDAAVIKTLLQKDIFLRLIFYVALRTMKRNAVGIYRNNTCWSKSFHKEAANLAIQIERLEELRSRQSAPKGHALSSNRKIRISQGEFSKSCSFFGAQDISSVMVRKRWKTACRDARNIKASAFDLIITDPPYGINKNTGTWALAKLYRDFIRAAIKGLKDNGQFIVCLPDCSFTGAVTPPFTHEEIVTHQVLAAAESVRCEIIHSAQIFPSDGKFFRPPYFWKSEKALGRKILHFRIRKVKGTRCRQKVNA